MSYQRPPSRVDARAGAPLFPFSAPLRLTPEVLVLALICTLDMLSTALFLHTGSATEANPLLRYHAELGPLWFMLVKLLSFAPALIAAEWYCRRRPEFVRPLLRLATSVYVTMYLSLVGRQFWG